MNPRDQLLAALRIAPDDETGWLALADCLEEDGEPRRAELTRLTRQVRAMRDGPRRRDVEARVIALLADGVRPCVPEVTNGVGMRLAFVSPGRFRMGSPARGEPRRMDDEGLHPVRITRGFWLGVFPVTQDEYRAVTRRAPSYHGRRRVTDEGVAHGRLPVENISWGEAAAFCRALSGRREEREAGRVYRLPTEAEWEFACRAGISTRYPFHLGPTLGGGQANFDTMYPYPPDGGVPEVPRMGRTCEVGRSAPNAWGLFDMHGNVDEWCADWYGGSYYADGPADDPAGPAEGSSRVIRGGSWRGQGEDCRAAVRIGYDPEGRFWHVGVRAACDARP